MRVGFLLIMVLALAGCEKKQDVFAFDCVVFDEKVNANVAGASVTMMVQEAAGGFNPNYVTVGTTTTDANGRFYIEVEKGVYYSYRVQVSHSNHFTGTFDISPDDVPFSKAYTATLPVEPKAWVSVHLKNENASQTVSYKVVAETDACTECCPSNTTYYQGSMVDTTITCLVYGNQNVSITGSYVDIDGGIHQVAETTFAQAFDTTTVIIIY